VKIIVHTWRNNKTLTRRKLCIPIIRSGVFLLNIRNVFVMTRIRGDNFLNVYHTGTLPKRSL
jgi:hypothetical protein